jgi:DNA polymerase-3 subunit gamma/tau
VRAMEVVGTMLVEFRHAPDPRLLLDVALVQLTNPDADTSNAALLERIERLEKQLADGAAPARTTAAPARASGPDGSPPAGGGDTGPGPAAARAVLGGAKARAAPAREPSPSPAPLAAPDQASAGPPATERTGPADTGTGGAPPTLDDVAGVWSADVLPSLRPLVRAMFNGGEYVAAPGGVAFVLPNASHRDRCEAHRAEVEAALAARLGRPFALQLGVADSGRPTGRPADRPPAEPGPFDDEAVNVDELVDAPPEHTDPVARLQAAFPGAEVVTEPDESGAMKGPGR